MNRKRLVMQDREAQPLEGTDILTPLNENYSYLSGLLSDESTETGY